IDLADIAGAAVMAVGSGNKTFDLSVDAPEDGVPYTGQPEGLRRLCENLLENAVRHGKTNGKAVISVTPDASGTGVTLACDDDGPGIPADEREIVKGRFERGSAANGNGSGLGLALVEQQAILHDPSRRAHHHRRQCPWRGTSRSSPHLRLTRLQLRPGSYRTDDRRQTGFWPR
ncbi:MAG: ATP-binding protein, partial [Solirubrobacterales bacterium]|nr:ATP-binding protein [Solirubrobacterales bacterium]